MSTKKRLVFSAMIGAGLLATVISTGCNNDSEKPAATEEKKTEAAPAATTTPPDTTVKPQMDTASTRPTKPGA